MKIKTSITLSKELLREIDRIIEGHTNRSTFIEQAIRSYLKQREREQRNSVDLEILNKHAARLNREASDVISFQVEL
jgi:metal-responsive CopG/Arc/MetJ family transcriptional regulator